MFKMNVKRLLSISMVLVILASFAACGNKKDIEDLSEDEVEEILEEMYGDQYEETSINADNNDGKINIDDIISSVNFNNFNGYGYVFIMMWGAQDHVSDEIIKQYVERVAPDLAAERYSQGYKYYFNDIVKFEPAEDYNRLSNGDTVIVNAVIADEFAERGVTIDSIKQGLDVDFDTQLTYTVSGLMQGGTPIDAFSQIEQFVQYEGGNGKIQAKVVFPENYTFESNGYYFKSSGSFSKNSLDVIYNNQQIASLDFEIEQKDYKSGDTVVIRIDDFEYKNSSLVPYGAFLSDEHKIATVPVVGEYVTDISQLTNEQIDFIKNELSNAVKSDSRVSSCTLKNFYAATYKPTETTYRNSNFVLVGVYETIYTDFLDGDVTKYYIQPLFDVIIKADGSIVYDESSWVETQKFETYAEVEDYINVSGSYICTLIG